MCFLNRLLYCVKKLYKEIFVVYAFVVASPTSMYGASVGTQTQHNSLKLVFNPSFLANSIVDQATFDTKYNELASRHEELFDAVPTSESNIYKEQVHTYCAIDELLQNKFRADGALKQLVQQVVLCPLPATPIHQFIAEASNTIYFSNLSYNKDKSELFKALNTIKNNIQWLCSAIQKANATNNKKAQWDSIVRLVSYCDTLPLQDLSDVVRQLLGQKGIFDPSYHRLEDCINRYKVMDRDPVWNKRAPLFYSALTAAILSGIDWIGGSIEALRKHDIGMFFEIYKKKLETLSKTVKPNVLTHPVQAFFGLGHLVSYETFVVDQHGLTLDAYYRVWQQDTWCDDITPEHFLFSFLSNRLPCIHKEFLKEIDTMYRTQFSYIVNNAYLPTMIEVKHITTLHDRNMLYLPPIIYIQSRLRFYYINLRAQFIDSDSYCCQLVHKYIHRANQRVLHYSGNTMLMYYYLFDQYNLFNYCARLENPRFAWLPTYVEFFCLCAEQPINLPMLCTWLFGCKKYFSDRSFVARDSCSNVVRPSLLIPMTLWGLILNHNRYDTKYITVVWDLLIKLYKGRISDEAMVDFLTHNTQITNIHFLRKDREVGFYKWFERKYHYKSIKYPPVGKIIASCIGEDKLPWNDIARILIKKDYHGVVEFFLKNEPIDGEKAPLEAQKAFCDLVGLQEALKIQSGLDKPIRDIILEYVY